MTREELDFIGAMNMCDEISNEAYRKITIHFEEQEPCEDCVSREAVFDWLCEGCERYHWNGDNVCLTKCEDYRTIAKLPPVQPKQDWIPVTERLPEEGINPITQDYYEYQCTIYLNEVYDLRFLRFGKGHWWNGGWLADDYVIAWMERPEPYKENKE